MAVLSREQVEDAKNCIQCCTCSCNDLLDGGCFAHRNNYIDTIKHLQAELEMWHNEALEAQKEVMKKCEELVLLSRELDRRELEHEKARRAVEVEFRETLDFMNSTVRVIEQERDRLAKMCCDMCINAPDIEYCKDNCYVKGGRGR